MQWDAERGRIAEEEKLIAAENRKKAEAQKVLDDAASAIQKIFRGMQARKATRKGKKVRLGGSNWMIRSPVWLGLVHVLAFLSLACAH